MHRSTSNPTVSGQFGTDSVHKIDSSRSPALARKLLILGHFPSFGCAAPAAVLVTGQPKSLSASHPLARLIESACQAPSTRPPVAVPSYVDGLRRSGLPGSGSRSGARVAGWCRSQTLDLRNCSSVTVRAELRAVQCECGHPGCRERVGGPCLRQAVLRRPVRPGQNSNRSANWI